MNEHFPIQFAKEAIIFGAYDEAFDVLRKLAASGHSDAQFLYGFHHFLNPALSRQQAITLLQQAADNGHGEARYVLTMCPDLEPEYCFVAPQTSEAWQEIQRAAGDGSASAKVELAKAYINGTHFEQDIAHAYELLLEVTDNSPDVHPEGGYLLTLLRLNGHDEAITHRQLVKTMYRASYEHFLQGHPSTIKGFEALIQLSLNRQWEFEPDSIQQLIDGEHSERLAGHQEAPERPAWFYYIMHYCDSTLYYDLTDASFDAFIAFIFEHVLAAVPKRFGGKWYDLARIDINPRVLIQHYITLFQNPAFLRERYDDNVIEAGMWEVRYNGEWGVGVALWHEDVTVEEAATCLRSVYTLFEKLFAAQSESGTGYMWWDLPMQHPIGGARNKAYREHTKETGHYLRDVVFETISRVLLELDNRDCQNAALHGFNHLRMPEKEQVINQFLDEHPDLDKKIRMYALHAIEGGGM